MCAIYTRNYFPILSTLVVLYYMQRNDDSSFIGRLRDPTCVYSDNAPEQAKSMSDFVVAIEMAPVAVKPTVVISEAYDPVSIQKGLLKDLKAKHMLTVDSSLKEN